MFGAAAALDAAQRGLRTALIERADFAGATSSHSFKMVHGGIRYLQHADLPRLRHSARARSAFLRSRAAPRPAAAHRRADLWPGHEEQAGPAGRHGAPTICSPPTATAASPIRRAGSRAGRSSAASEVRRRYPGLAPAGPHGRGHLLRRADVQPAAPGAGLCAERGRRGRRLRQLCRGRAGWSSAAGGCRAFSPATRLGGDRIEIRGRFVLNAAGPYAEWILRRRPRPRADPTDAVLPRRLLHRAPAADRGRPCADRAVDHAPTATRSSAGAAATCSWCRGAGRRWSGVWHKVYQGHPDTYEIAEAELAGLDRRDQRAYGGLDLTLADVALGSAGLVPYRRERSRRHGAQVRPSLAARRSPRRARASTGC